MIILNENYVNPASDDGNRSLSLIESHLESNEYDKTSSSDDEVFIETKPLSKDIENCLSIDIQRTMASHKKCVVCNTKDSRTKLKKLKDEIFLMLT